MAEEAGPVAHRRHEVAAVDEIEMCSAIRPVLLDVLDFKRAVRRHVRGLCRADVHAEDLSTRVLVGHVHGPNPRACAEIQNPAVARVQLVFRDGRHEETFFQQKMVLVVLQVVAIQLLLVNGHAVFMFAVRRVQASLDFHAASHL